MINDTALAAYLALQTGERLRSFRNEQRYNPNLDPHEFGHAADRLANDYLLMALATLRPRDAVLSEESPDDRRRLQRERVWIVDPLDGTREYREGGNDWAIHVALVSAGQVIAAAVCEPEKHRVVATETDSTHPPLQLRRPSLQQVVISRTRPPQFAPAVAQALKAELVQLGSAGCKAMTVITGEAIAYVHAGGINEWDVAAPAGVAQAYGLTVCDLRGEPIPFNQPQTVLRHGLIVCQPELRETILKAVNS